MCRLASATFAPTVRAPGLARRWVGEWLNRWEFIDGEDDVAVMVSELVTNAVRHTDSVLTISLAVAEGTVEVGVADHDGQAWPVAARPAPVDTPLISLLPDGGRGLHLVSALAQEWGVAALDRGKQVWFRRRLAGRWPYAPACVCGGERIPAVRLGSGRRAVAITGPWDQTR
jgi:anti-sigma regulatory factor (Ser/Thr protein kinase)